MRGVWRGEKTLIVDKKGLNLHIQTLWESFLAVVDLETRIVILKIKHIQVKTENWKGEESGKCGNLFESY